MLNFPDNPVDGKISEQDNGVIYQWSAAKTRWQSADVPQFPAVLGNYTVLGAGSHLGWTPDPRTVSIRFTLTGGGGGGGGVSSGGSDGSMSRGGSAGATAIKFQQAPEASYDIVVGAGGLGASSGSNDGADGAQSTLTSILLALVAGAGTGGGGSSGGTNNNREGNDGGEATGGDLNLSGGDSMSGRVIDTRPSASCDSGGSYWGGGLRSRSSSGGIDATSPGVGGGGVSRSQSSGNNGGGDGADGVCVIEEFFAMPVDGQNGPAAAKVWCSFDGTLTGTNPPESGYGVASVTRVSTGTYEVNFSDPMANADYAAVASSNTNHCNVTDASDVNQCRISVVNNSHVNIDTTRVSLVVFG